VAVVVTAGSVTVTTIGASLLVVIGGPVTNETVVVATVSVTVTRAVSKPSVVEETPPSEVAKGSVTETVFC
jgi:hypothetical protein